MHLKVGVLRKMIIRCLCKNYILMLQPFKYLVERMVLLILVLELFLRQNTVRYLFLLGIIWVLT